MNGIRMSNGVAVADPTSDLLAAVNSRESLAQRVREIALTTRATEWPGLSESLLAEVVAHNESCSRLAGDCQHSVKQLTDKVLTATDSDDFTDLFAATEEARTDHPLLVQQAVRNCVRAIELARAALTERAQLPAELDEEAEKVVSKVKTQLTKIGCGVEAQQASLHNYSAAAERQFDVIARTHNIHSRAAINTAKDARAVNQAIQESIGRYNANLLEAKKLLVSVARKAITG